MDKRIIIDAQKSLQNKRRTLLESIDQAQHSKNSESSIITGLRVEFNRISSGLSRFRSSSGRDPLVALPPQIWEDIIHIASVGKDINCTKKIVPAPIDTILECTLVSRRWQAAIMSSPRLWSHLYVGGEVHDIVDKIRWGLRLSNESPLTLYLGDELEKVWRLVERMISAQSFRLHFIELADSEATLETQIHYILSIQDLGSVRSLKSRRREVDTARNLGPLLQRSKSIQVLEDVSISAEAMGIASLRRLQTLTTHVPPNRLPSLIHLKEVSFRFDYDDDSEDTRNSPPNGVEPLQWQRLDINDLFYGPSNESLFTRTTSTLVSLYTEIPWSRLANLLTTCSSMPSLCHLFFSIDYGDPLHKLALTAIPPSNTLRSLAISAFLWSGEVSPGNYVENMAALFSFLTNWTPYLQYFNVNAPVQSDIISYTESLKGLSKVRLTLSGEPNSSSVQEVEQAMQVSEIKSEEVKFDGSPKIFKRYSGREVLELSLNLTYFELPALRTALNPDLWINLRSLEIVPKHKDWGGISLPHLRKLVLGKSEIATDPSSISSLCKELASNVGSFPSLEVIWSYSIPEWDLLILMLERRNCLSNLGVTRITSLSFSMIPPLFILRPLTQLLRGELPIYDSLEEFSLLEISKKYFDPIILGCTGCHLFCQPCSKFHGAIIHWRSVVPWSLDYRYPMTPDEILATHERRLNTWLEFIKFFERTQFFRPRNCSRHSISPLPEITGYTLHGSNIKAFADLYRSRLTLKRR